MKNITFGKFDSSNKSKKQLDSWHFSLDLFKEKKYFKCYENFFNYLKDENLDNLKFKLEKNKIIFSLYEGSKKVYGEIDDKNVKAEVKIAKINKTSVPVMRKLLDLNYKLFYSRYCIKDNYILLKFNSSILDCSPWKFFYSLNELAIQSDRIDDILIDKFSSLNPVDISHIVDIPEKEKIIKIKYMKKIIKNALDFSKTVDETSFSGGLSYHYLNTTFKIYYLINPEGILKEKIKKIFYFYFDKSDKRSLPEKNAELYKKLENIMLEPDKELKKNLYKVYYTFGTFKKSTIKEISDFIEKEANNYKWYYENKYYLTVNEIFEYAISYSLGSFGIPKPLKEIFHLLMIILNQQYFLDLGYKNIYFYDDKKALNTELIKNKLTQIIKDSKKLYPDLKIHLNRIKWGSLHNFLHSILFKIRNINFNLKE